MSRRTALVAVWFAGTVLAAALAYGAVVLVRAGVSGHAAERLRYGRTVAIEQVRLRPATTEDLPRRTRQRSTTTLPAPATTAPAKPDDHGAATGGSGTGGEAPNGDGGTLPAGPQGTIDPGGDGSGSGSGGDGGHESPSPTTVAAPQTTVSSTFAATGGAMTVSCAGVAIRLVSSSPTSGYTMNVDRSGPDEVKVRFRSDENESELQAHCSGGRPVLDD